jgi:hypothetical protein
MKKTLEKEVRRRAGHLCEYCLLRESDSLFPHVIDHITAQQHHGATASENLALCCIRCNAFKGPNLTGIDPKSGKITRLFNPRKDRWARHFEWSGALLIGRTSIGRATIDVLAINLSSRVRARQALLELAQLPPQQEE